MRAGDLLEPTKAADRDLMPLAGHTWGHSGIAIDAEATRLR
jgi:hypothetical protein